jgi:cell shape-determining protein MreC
MNDIIGNCQDLKLNIIKMIKKKEAEIIELKNEIERKEDVNQELIDKRRNLDILENQKNSLKNFLMTK